MWKDVFLWARAAFYNPARDGFRSLGACVRLVNIASASAHVLESRCRSRGCVSALSCGAVLEVNRYRQRHTAFGQRKLDARSGGHRVVMLGTISKAMPAFSSARIFIGASEQHWVAALAVSRGDDVSGFDQLLD